jgi:hypothetical protein
MNGSVRTSPSIGDLFFPSTTTESNLEQALHQGDALHRAVDALERVPAPLAHVASGRVASVFAALLQMDLVDVLVGGWTKYNALMSAARASLDTPGEERVVELATHQITSTHEPSIELEIDGIDAGSIDIAIELTATVHALVAVVRAGTLTSLRSGRIDLAATLSCEGLEITSVSRELDPSLAFDLGEGIPLVRPSYVKIPDPPLPLIKGE